MSKFGIVSDERYKQIALGLKGSPEISEPTAAKIFGGETGASVRYRIFPYKQGSKAAKELSRELGGLVLKTEGSTFTPRAEDVLINWGSSKPYPRIGAATILNPPEAVAIATNKLEFLKLMATTESSFTPEFWTDKEQIPANAYPVVCRTVLSGHSGEGIVIADTPDELVDAPLYVKYIKKTDEYRVHVGKEMQIIAVQRKGRDRSIPDEQVNWKIRNRDNGFVYVRQNVSAPACVTQAAIKALQVSGLDFGAVDVIYHGNDHRGFSAKVLEINTAPGLAGTTVRDYARYFKTKKGQADEPAG